jgi:aquaporin Z
MKKYLIEFIGTFFLVFTIALGANPIAVGGILTAMVYMGGYISGAHYNPAVSLAVLIRGKMTVKESLFYMLSQVVAGAVAAVVFYLMAKSYFTPLPGEGLAFPITFASEVIYTFALASVVLHVATSDKLKDNYYYGLAIGLVVMAAGFAIGPVSGAALNPAVALGPILVDFKHIGQHGADLGLYLGGPLLGGALAAAVYRLTNPKES